MVDRPLHEEIFQLGEDPAEFRDVTNELVRYGDGEYGACVDLDKTLNLNALAIGLGLENVEYDPERLNALVYRHAGPAVLFLSDGQVLVLAAASKVEAKDVLEEALEDAMKVGEMMDDSEMMVGSEDVEDLEILTMRTT